MMAEKLRFARPEGSEDEKRALRMWLNRNKGDWDAKYYLARLRSAANTELDPIEKANLSAFIKGLKFYGMWNSLVEGWSFRSGQNAGVGTIAYGLKGVKDGLITGGAAWGLNGLTLDATTKAVGLTAQTTFAGTNPWTVLFIFDYLGADAARPFLAYSGASGSQPQSVTIETSTTSPLIRKYLAGAGSGITAAITGAVAGFGYVAASRVVNDWYIEQNGTNAVGFDTVSLAGSVDYNLGNSFSSGPVSADIVLAHTFIFNQGLDLFGSPTNTVNLVNLINLLKLTIAQGLGL